MTINPSSSSMIISFLLIFTICIFISKYISAKVVRYKEKKIDARTFLESQQQIHGDIFLIFVFLLFSFYC